MKNHLKKIIVFLALLLVIISCKESKNETNDLIGDQLCELKNPQKVFLSAIGDIKNYKDSLLFVIDKRNYRIYKYEIATDSISVLGNIGEGPGEYKNPFYLFIKKDTVFFTDMNAAVIKKIDFNGKYLGKVAYSASIKGKNICADENTVYVAGSGTLQDYYVSAINGNKYFIVPNVYKNITKNTFAGSRLFMLNNYLYFMNSYEMKIFVADLKSKKEESLNLNGMHRKFDWSNYEGENISPERMEEISKAEIDHFPIGFNVFYNGGRRYYAVLCAVNESDKKEYEMTLGIYNEKGSLLVNVKINTTIPFLFENDTVWTYDITKEGISKISRHYLSPNILNVLKTDKG